MPAKSLCEEEEEYLRPLRTLHFLYLNIPTDRQHCNSSCH